MTDESSQIEEIEEKLITIILVTNVLSAFSALLMIASYYKFVELQTFAFKIVLFLNISDLFLALGNIMILTPTPPSQYESGVWCELQSFIVNASQLSSIMQHFNYRRWTAIIAYVLYQSSINRKTEDSMSIAIYLFFGFLLPLILSLYPIFTGDYGFAGISCWIKLDVNYAFTQSSNQERTTIIQFINFYAPLMIIILYNSLVYLMIICKLYGEMVHNQNKFIYKMLSYPLILIICWIFTAFNRTYTEITNEQHVWLLYISKTLSGLMGFFNYIGYGFTPQVMHSMYLFCCPRKDKTITLELEQQNNEPNSQRGSVESQIKSSRGNSFINELI